MKQNNLTLIIALLLFSVVVNAQIETKDELLTVIAQETCDCFIKKDIDIENTDSSKIELEFGFCIMESYANHKTVADKFLNISFDDEKSLENLGIEVGMKMVSICPDALMAFAGDYEEEYLTTETTGEFIKIETEQFNVIHIKDGNNRTLKLLWFNYFEGEDLFADPKVLKDKVLSVEYEEIELYDPNIEDYRNFKVITKAILL